MHLPAFARERLDPGFKPFFNKPSVDAVYVRDWPLTRFVWQKTRVQKIFVSFREGGGVKHTLMVLVVVLSLILCSDGDLLWHFLLENNTCSAVSSTTLLIHFISFASFLFIIIRIPCYQKSCDLAHWVVRCSTRVPEKKGSYCSLFSL